VSFFGDTVYILSIPLECNSRSYNPKSTRSSSSQLLFIPRHIHLITYHFVRASLPLTFGIPYLFTLGNHNHSPHSDAMADATSCRQSKMAANQTEVVISRKLRNVSSKFQRLPLCFRCQRFYSDGTSDFVGRRWVLEIQDGSQITGSSNNFDRFTDTHVVSKTVLSMSHTHGLCYLVSKIQHGSQVTGSSNISETMTYIIKIPTANLYTAFDHGKHTAESVPRRFQ